jgi:hypothetical protein
MKSGKPIRFPGLVLISIALALFAVSAHAAETNSLRLAVGPFFAPPDNQPLQRTAAMLPDLLTVSLSKQNQFQLVERQKVAEVWRELKLTIHGLNSANAVLNLGRVLACDEFVTGTFVVTRTNTQIWISVIDTRSGVLTDLKLLPFNATNLDAALETIASALDQTRTRNPSQKFIALGRFLDLSISATRENWSDRLRALIGRYFVEAGYAVVDNETVAPIYEEFQLDRAGLSESPTNRVKFQPSFWLIEGRCKWVRDTEDQLSVAIRVRKLGVGEKEFQFRAPPGPELVSNVCATIENDLTSARAASLEQAAGEETKISEQEVTEAAKGKTLLPPTRFSTNAARLTDLQIFEQKQALYMEEARKRAQRALLLDPNNLKAKQILAADYFAQTNEPALQERGRQMLEELSTCTNDAIAYTAYSLLAHGISFNSPTGKTVIVQPSRAVDAEREANNWQKTMNGMVAGAETRFAANTNDLNAKFALADAYFTALDNTNQRLRGMSMLEEIFTNLNVHPQYREMASNTLANGIGIGDWKSDAILIMPVQPPASLTNFNSPARAKSSRTGPMPFRPAFAVVDTFPGSPVAAPPDAGWLIGAGPKLFFYNPQGEKTEVSCPARHNISALAADHDFWWVGTEGDGLFRIPKFGGSPKVWTEADGLLMPAISALCRQGDRLWVGFNFHGSGGLGYLDVKTGKFAGLQRDANFSGPVDAPVVFLQAANDKSFWVYSDYVLQQRDSASGQVIRTIPTRPVYLDKMSANSNFLVIATSRGDGDDIGGVKIYNLTSNHWQKVNFSNDSIENRVSALCVDGQYVWAGGTSKMTGGDSFITLVDLPSSKILARYAFENVEGIFWIGVTESAVWFSAGAGPREVKLYRFEKPTAANSFAP